MPDSAAPPVSPLPVSPETRAWIDRLIAFDTTSRNSNMALIDDVRGYLANHGVESVLVKDPATDKANLYATLGPATNAEGRGGIALSGHTDVVPIDGQEWDSDPWTVLERDGKLYGRGTSDMKAFIAICLTYVPKFLAAGPTTPIHLCFSFDEEVGCIGARHLLAYLASQPVKPRCAIVGEPTSMKVINAHKGKASLRCKVRGHECHSSLAPTGVNAVQEAAKVIAKIAEIAARKRVEGPFDHAFDVPYSTVHCGTVQGGTALNIVPKDCSFDFEMRNIAGDDSEPVIREIKDYAQRELEPAMRAVAADTGFAWEALGAFAGLDTPEDSEVVTLAKALAGANDTGKVAFGTEAGLFSETGIPAVVCGPGSIEQAHKPNEWIALEQVALGERFMDRLVERVSGKARSKTAP